MKPFPSPDPSRVPAPDVVEQIHFTPGLRVIIGLVVVIVIVALFQAGRGGSKPDRHSR